MTFALVDNRRSLSPTDTSRAVAAGIGVLRHHGVRQSDHVVLVTGNTIEGVVAYHALLQLGAVARLLDRRCGERDLQAALDGLARPIVIAAAERSPNITLDKFANVIDTPPAELPADSPPARDTPAVVLFTSGTTGKPKGVVHSLDTLRAGAANMARITGADEQTVAFLVSPLASITGVMQMHLAVDYGCTLVLEDDFEPEHSLDRVLEHGATLIGGAPVIAERLLRTAVGRELVQLPLRTLALGGAMLPMPLIELATYRFGIEVARIYGSSEAPNSTGSLPTDDRVSRLNDDGRLMPGTEIKVGSSRHPQEGLLRGPQLFLGYLDPADDAAASEDGWFRTGDAVELHAGRVTVLGRIDDIVNRNGLKISPSEIDHALARLPGVVEHAAFGVPDAETCERLALAVRLEPDATLTLATVQAHLRDAGVAVRKLPEQLVVWDVPLPRTASGKIVRSSLVRDAPAKRNEYAARVAEHNG